MKSWFNFFFVLFFCFIFVRATKSQIKIQKKLDVEDGLVQSEVYCIHEAYDRYLWFGTADGLSRWDGINFANLQTQDGLAGRQVVAIHESQDGTLYFGTSNGVSVYRNNKFSTLNKSDGLANNQVNAIAEDKNGTIYFGTSGGVSIYKDGKFETLNTEKGLANDRVKVINITKEGTLYIGTLGGGVSIYKNDKFRILNAENGLASDHVLAICKGKDGKMYFGTADGLSIYRNGKFEPLSNKSRLQNYQINSIHEASNGNLYMGTNGAGVHVFKDGNSEFITEKHGLTDNWVESIYESRDGTLYFGTEVGVSLYQNGKFETLNQEGLTKNSVQTIYEDSKGTMYFSGQGDGVFLYKNNEMQRLTERDGLAHNWVISIAEDKDGVLYFGTDFRGVSIYKNGKFQTINKESGLPSNNIFSIFTGKDGRIYFGFWNRGVGVYKEGKFIKIFGEEDGLPKSPFYTIYESKGGTLYLGTRGSGIFIYENNRLIKKLNSGNGLVNDEVYSIHEAKDGTFYFGTLEGLGVYRNSSFDTLDMSDGLSGNRIYGILEDDDGKIYLSTDKGVNILDFSNAKLFIRTLRHSDGLASDECRPNVYFKDHRGHFWFGTVKGITRYNPEKDKPNKLPPRVYITRISVFDLDVPLTPFPQNPVFKHNQNYIKFDFIGINLSAPEKVSYRYRLKSIDKDWIETNKRFVQYTTLDDGDYTFELKAMNEWGFWSEPVIFNFSILPPFWQTWWFISLVVLVTVGNVTYLVTNRMKHLLATERLRTKIAADLHDSIGSDLAEITIMSEVSMQHLNQDAKKQATQSLKKISQISRSVVKSMSDIVWLVNPKRDSLYDLILRLRDSYAELFVHRGIELDIQNLEALSNIHLPMEYRQHLYLIFKEWINNSLKHSNCKRILLDTRVTGKQFKMVIKDDGKGFDMEKPNPGNDSGDGLANMKKRAESIGGTLSIDSTKNGGTVIEFVGKI